MKLWQKGEDLHKAFEQFTIGKDPELDLHIASFDVIASKAHVNMLGKIRLLLEDEVKKLETGLDEILQDIELGKFIIEEGVEDCHSQIELLLTNKLGDIGKKVHSGRSRNDQVLTALKLYALHELKLIADKMKSLFELFIAKSEETKATLMPGYTHMQVAMPSSFGMWFGAYAESLVDDLIQLKASYQIVDKNPLGSAAGYGSSFPLDREMTTKEMNFSGLNINSIYAQATRGKMEKTVAVALSSIASTLGKFAMDVCLYAGQNFEFIKIEKQFTTGSSIMPHKNNPDGFELVRAKCNQIQSLPYELNLILGNLPSGYHRDLQVIKENFIQAINTLKACLDITVMMTENIKVNVEVLDDPKYDAIYSVEAVNKLVLEGVPFRDAYLKVSQGIKTGEYEVNKSLDHSHIGSIGNLGNDLIRKSFDEVFGFFEKTIK